MRRSATSCLLMQQASLVLSRLRNNIDPFATQEPRRNHAGTQFGFFFVECVVFLGLVRSVFGSTDEQLISQRTLWCQLKHVEYCRLADGGPDWLSGYAFLSDIKCRSEQAEGRKGNRPTRQGWRHFEIGSSKDRNPKAERIRIEHWIGPADESASLALPR